MTAPYHASALEPDVTAPLVLALPKGRILAECGQLLARAGVVPAPDYADEESRRLRFPTDDPTLDVVTTLAQRAALRSAVLEEGRELLSADVRARYRLGGPSTVQASLSALVREDILAREGGRYAVVDSLMREWVARKTF